MTSNNILKTIAIISGATLYSILGILLLSLDKTLGIIVIGSFLINKLANFIYLYNEVKQKTEQINNLIKSMNGLSLDVDNVIEFKKEDK